MVISHQFESELFAQAPPLQGLRMVLPIDPDYPTNLGQLPQCPDRLYYLGTLKKSDTRAVAIVGSRLCSELGARQAFELAAELARHDVTIVSGLAKGIDAAAHRGALSVSGRTIAVLGTGLDKVTPHEHQELSRQVAQSGALVSQFGPGFTGYPSGRHFLKRNYVVSGLAQIVVVIEAQLRSGTANTINQALNQGRKVGLLSSLVQAHGWAAELAEHPQVFIVRGAECVLERLEF